MYRSLLGAAWLELPACIQRLHEVSRLVHGRFEVRRGKGHLAILIANLLKLPPATPSTDIQLTVEQCGDSQRWIRRFGGVTVSTIQWSASDQLLWERFGMIELGFKLEVECARLIYRQNRAAFRILRRWPMPLWLAPRVTAIEEPARQADVVVVTVEVALPVIGLLLAYHGTLNSSMETPA